LAIGLRHLRVVLAVVDQGSVSQAAATLYRAQSAVSRSIHELEKEFGVPLFARRDIASADVPVETSDPAVGQARRRRPAAGGRRLTLGPLRPILRVAPGDVRALTS